MLLNKTEYVVLFKLANAFPGGYLKKKFPHMTWVLSNSE